MTRIPPPHLCGLGCGSQTVVVHKVRAKNRPCQSFYVEMLLTNLKAGETRVGYAGSSLTSTRATASDCTNNRTSSQQHRNSSNRDNGMGRESRSLIESIRAGPNASSSRARRDRTLPPGPRRQAAGRDPKPTAPTPNSTPEHWKPTPHRPLAPRSVPPPQHTLRPAARAPRRPHDCTPNPHPAGAGRSVFGRGPAPDRRTSVGSDSATRIA